ncbi:MAG: PilZ domain-containing protein [Planctomycetes bacterium]|nr:PilZ domain-containing protein [Planctomycetota bacterium]
MEKKRSQKRWHLIYYLRVFDRDTNEMIGHLVNITTEGIMLISDQQIALDKIFHLRMLWPTEGGETEELTFDAKSVWCGNDANPDYFDTGFKLIDPSSGLCDQIRQVVMELGLAD